MTDTSPFFYGRPLFQAWLLPDLNKYLTTVLRRILFSSVVMVLAFRPGIPGSNPVQILYFCHAFVSLLRTLFIRIHSGHICWLYAIPVTVFAFFFGFQTKHVIIENKCSAASSILSIFDVYLSISHLGLMAD